MTSEERKERRYQRRKYKREIKKKMRSYENSNFEDSFGFNALITSFKKCSKTNKWKTSVKLFNAKLTIECAKLAKVLRNGSYRPSKFRCFTILERGHLRTVQSLHISDMTVQGSFRDNCLHPIIRPYLIYDNGACLSNKGTNFALKRFVRHLKYHIDKHGNKGYIYFFDFKSYFKNIRRSILDERIKEILYDKRMYDYYHMFSSSYSDDGLGLGSSVSQICAVYYPNKIDHFVKDRLRIKGYGRYMDDGYIICESKEKLKEIVQMFECECEKNGVSLNKKKCKIVKITDHYTFLKSRFSVTQTGRIIRKQNKKANVIERRKIKKFKSLMEEGKITFSDALLYFHSWLCSRISSRSYRSNFNMIKHFNNMFNGIGRYKPPSIKSRKVRVLNHLSKIA